MAVSAPTNLCWYPQHRWYHLQTAPIWTSRFLLPAPWFNRIIRAILPGKCFHILFTGKYSWALTKRSHAGQMPSCSTHHYVLLEKGSAVHAFHTKTWDTVHCVLYSSEIHLRLYTSSPWSLINSNRTNANESLLPKILHLLIPKYNHLK